MNKFEKISLDQFKKDCKNLYPHLSEESILEAYNNIKLPKRATIGSAGYDFYLPFPVDSMKGYGTTDKDYITAPTGIRWVTDNNSLVLIMAPRSGLGFKNGMYLSNTIGVIDSTYADSSNEGHILVKFGSRIQDIILEAGKAFVQGIIMPYFTVDNEEEITTVRNGGFGSTDKN